jgi:hypothetical protein
MAESILTLKSKENFKREKAKEAKFWHGKYEPKKIKKIDGIVRARYCSTAN